MGPLCAVRDGLDRSRRPVPPAPKSIAPAANTAAGAAESVRPDREHRRHDDRADQHDPAQRRQPVRRAVQQDERPHAGGRRHGRQHEPRPRVLPAPPQLAHRDPDQRRDRRRQGDRVVRVDDAVHEAEHRAGHQQPAAPQQQARRGHRPVRGVRRVNHSPATRPISAAGNSQDASAPIDGPNSRPMPGVAAEEHVARSAGPPPPPGRRRDRALGRRRRCGRFRCSPTPAAAGCCRWSRRCRAGSRRATGRPARGTSPRTRSSRRRRPAACRCAATFRRARRPGTPARGPGTTRNACSILVRNAKPIAHPPARSSGCCAVSMARTMQYAAATSSSTSSASGLLNRNINAATGVSASAAPAIRPAAGSADAAHRRVQQRDRTRRPSVPAAAAW